jgi:hypothetical protein
MKGFATAISASSIVASSSSISAEIEYINVSEIGMRVVICDPIEGFIRCDEIGL